MHFSSKTTTINYNYYIKEFKDRLRIANGIIDSKLLSKFNRLELMLTHSLTFKSK